MLSVNDLRLGGFRTSFETRQLLASDSDKETPSSGLSRPFFYERETSSIVLAITPVATLTSHVSDQPSKLLLAVLRSSSVAHVAIGFSPHGNYPR